MMLLLNQPATLQPFVISEAKRWYFESSPCRTLPPQVEMLSAHVAEAFSGS
jgi:hypothetical protein